MDHQEAQRHSEDEQIPATLPAVPATPPAVPANNRYPPGYRFMPRDSELILDYLQKKIANEPIPIAEINDTFIKEVNPRELTAKYPKLGDNEWYFFTPRDRKYPNGIRPDRGSNSGYWKATGADKPVMVGDLIIGFRKALVFYEGKPQKGQKTNWIMHEFRVNGAARKKRTADDMRLDDWVLCRIYENSSRPRNNRKNKKAKEQCDHVDESPLQASNGAAVTNPYQEGVKVVNELENLPTLIPENDPYSYNYFPETNIDNIIDDFGDCSLDEYLQQESDRNGYFPSYNLDGIVNPVEQVNAFGDPYLNEDPLGFQQPNDPSSSSWISNQLPFQQQQPNDPSSSSWSGCQLPFQQQPNDPSSSWSSNPLPFQPNAPSSWRSNLLPFQQPNAHSSPWCSNPLAHQLPNSSSWSSNEGFLPSDSVPANNSTTNVSPIYSQIDAQQDNKRFRSI